MNTSLVTVFGGSGFLGRNTVRALANAGHRVRVAVRYPNSAYFLPPMGKVGQIQLVKCNVTDADQVAAALVGADAAVNLTGILAPGGGQGFGDIHIDAAESIAKAASTAGTKALLQVSAIGADPQSPSRYAATKGEGEARVRAAFPDATILRPSLLFGPEDDFFNRFAWLSRFTPALPLIGGGHTRFQPVFVGDVAAAILRALDDTGTRGKVYELGGPAIYSFKELMELLLRQIGRRRLLVPMPFPLASFNALFLQLLPSPLLTPDQVILLKSDNVVHDGALMLSDLGITPDSLEAILPSYLWRFRAKGQYQDIVRERAGA